MDKLDVVVIGAGVVGLAAARALALTGREVIVLEAENEIGVHASSRNSEVIHAGIYYPAGSLKARTCVAGKRLLYNYCEQRGIGHKKIGKLLVATHASEQDQLKRIVTQAEACGVRDLTALSTADLAAMEPNIHAVAAVLSPSTGIIDSHQLMLNLQGDLERAGGFVVLDSPVIGGKPWANGVELTIGGSSACTSICNTVINCAGLWAPTLAERVGVDKPLLPQANYARGHYFTLAGRSPFQHLVYPMPSAAGLGVHLTMDLAGQARFGPDVQWIDAIDYSFADGLEAPFRAAIASYYPAIADREIHQSYCGIRAKIVPDGKPAADFLIDDQRTHGVPGLINLFGIESPGLTACMALGDQVVQRVKALQ